ncbi:hypothetical protein [Rhizobium lusitanum]|uniref:hypothetical protein n=1 Tax=Rhizobium lusitanum TaxID=293958 RepID=UPI00114CCF99|nr:hypothetical protein [Rhizobium lusitanum]
MGVKATKASTGYLDLGKAIISHVSSRPSDDVWKPDPNPDACIAGLVAYRRDFSGRRIPAHGKDEQKQLDPGPVTKRARHGNTFRDHALVSACEQSRAIRAGEALTPR